MDYQESRETGAIESTQPNSRDDIQSPILHPNATCWEVLTVMLGRFTREYIEKHGSGSLTDEMLQAEARRILYGDPDDVWNQTEADNPEWLSLFKKAHGLQDPGQVMGMFRFQTFWIHSSTWIILFML